MRVCKGSDSRKESLNFERVGIDLRLYSHEGTISDIKRIKVFSNIQLEIHQSEILKISQAPAVTNCCVNTMFCEKSKTTENSLKE